jgi:uncharacterized protein YndB with AHSA1/START domain
MTRRIRHDFSLIAQDLSMSLKEFGSPGKYVLEHISSRCSSRRGINSFDESERAIMGDGTSEGKLTKVLTRRRAIAAVAMGWGAMVLKPIVVRAESDGGISHTAEAIHQENTFKASRKRVYEALTDTRQFDKVIEISGAKKSPALGTRPTLISGEVGGGFVIFGGHIIGRQIELVPDTRIIQAWRVVDWEPGIYSIARFELREQVDGTRIVFDHTGFPKGLGSHLAEGWRLHYWEPLEKFLA